MLTPPSLQTHTPRVLRALREDMNCSLELEALESSWEELLPAFTVFADFLPVPSFGIIDMKLQNRLPVKMSHCEF